MTNDSAPRLPGAGDGGQHPPLGEHMARQVFGDSFEGAKRYRDLLAAEGIDWGLIGPGESDRLWERHILNSVAVADLVPQGADIVDVGSGAGLPGIPLALKRPDLGMTLLEPSLRRVNFLTMVIEELRMDSRVAVERGRAEDHEGSFDVVTCRAVANLAKLLPWVAPLLARYGQIVAIKGSSARAEIANAGRVLAKHRLRAEILEIRSHPQAQVTTVIRARRP